MNANLFRAMVLIFIISIFIGVFSIIAYLTWTTYKQESMCSNYYKGNTEHTKALILDKSISVDDGCPHPFLAYSSKIGDTSMVKFLIENGAKIKQKFSYKRPKVAPYVIKHTPLFYAIYGKYELKKINFPLEIDEKYIAALEMLVQNGADLHTPCGREYKDGVSDSLKTAYRTESPDTQNALDIIKLIDHPLLNDFAEKHTKPSTHKRKNHPSPET